MEKTIEIPFGAKDSELKGWEYTIPEGMEAEIKDGKIIVREKEGDDERIRKDLITFICQFAPEHLKVQYVAYLERQKEQKPLSTEETELNSIAFLEQMGYTCIPPRKEQKPAAWSDSVAKEMFIKALERAVEQTKKGYELTDCDKHSWWEDFKAYSGIKPAEWSEEDKTNLKDLHKFLFSLGDLPHTTYVRLDSWLKSLRPQPKVEWMGKE